MSVISTKRQRLSMVSFRVDDEVLAALEDLERSVGDGVVTRRRRSIAIRKALLEARDRLQRARPTRRA